MLLFLIRVKCVFFESKQAKIFFILLWVVTSVRLLVVPFSFTESMETSNGLCIVERLSRLGSIPSFTIGVFDVTIFASVSYQIIVQSATLSWQERVIAFFAGIHIGPMSKALVRTGQLYFL